MSRTQDSTAHARTEKDPVVRELAVATPTKAEKLNRRAKSGGHSEDFIATPTAQRILGALAHAQQIGDLAVVYGGPGVGKTSAARHYQRTQLERVWIATMTPSASGLVSALEQVGEAVGLRDASGGARRLSAAIRTRIAGTRGLVIIDEAQHMSLAAIEELRAIHDVTQVGLALLGNETSYARLTGGTRAAHYAQLWSRVGMRVALPKPSMEDVEAVLSAWGVTDEEAIVYLKRLALKPGALRGVTKTLRLLGLRKHEVNVNTLRVAVAALGAEV